jgi:hypothetical protein
MPFNVGKVAPAARGVAPRNTVAPAIVGPISLGGTLAITAGTWTGSPAPRLTYAVRRAGTAIASGLTLAAAQAVAMTKLELGQGAAGTTGPNIDVIETATNDSGSATAASNVLNYNLATDLGASIVELHDERGQTVVAGHISAWADQSGAGITLSQATAGSRPTDSLLNGYAAPAFDGVDDSLFSAVLGSQPYPVQYEEFYVAQTVNHTSADATPDQNAPLYEGMSLRDHFAGVRDTGFMAGHFSGSRKYTTPIQFTDGATHLFHDYYDGVNVNALVDEAGLQQIAAGNIGYFSDHVGTGRNDGGFSAFHGTIGTILICSLLAAGKRANAVAFLQGKYGL